MSKISTNTSTKVDITSKVGDSFYLKASLTDDNDVAVVIATSFPSAVATMVILDANGASVLTFSSPSEITIGVSSMVIQATNTEMNLRAGSYKYSVVITSTSLATTVLNGKLKMK